ncbi:MAG: bifunctional phosphoribosylaminoimidazolecarboxamide formyltransferase/IMP cyclohydrolase [Anaerolineae bacterium]|nr:bifunctional phosphoribosylaminoimidazolecarboxamide formyltransferase/IMP cyclohydrolase [Anaerolineae bacterium]MDW8067391.1 bifunctional phosphoribosylaminoimidazolecarboxamide formyltransferase/IMP cyclohydrolase [Anaerolineae bacterium]
MSRLQRALLSVHDKTGLVDFARGLAQYGVELIASGGTARALREAGLDVTEVAQVTGFPEVLGGRVKTLHPAIHAALLATDAPSHQEELRNLGIRPIDLVACNLYPFSQVAADPGVSLEEAVENIDIGGVTLLRAAAKNFARVTVVTDPADYGVVLDELAREGMVSEATRRRLAYKAFAHTAAYDEAIRTFLGQRGFAGVEERFPSRLTLHLTRYDVLRYGENPHQQAALYHFPGVAGPLGGQLLQGKPLSYNNILDLAAAWQAAQEFPEPTVVIVKHNNPCGLASASSLAAAYGPALAGDPVSAFGGIIAVNRPLDGETARQLGDLFLECIAAPAFLPEAREILAPRTQLRLLEIPGTRVAGAPWEIRSVPGGLLVQEPDTAGEDEEEWKVVTGRAPSPEEWEVLRFAWRAVKHVKSNAIVFARRVDGALALVGVGAGQMSRVDAVRIAALKAGARAAGAVMASDAFFPFPDGVEEAARAGITAVIQPGGSVRDADVIATADRLGLAMVFTGRRHFRH